MFSLTLTMRWVFFHTLGTFPIELPLTDLYS